MLKTLIYIKILNVQHIRMKYSKYIYDYRIRKNFLNQIPQEVIKKTKFDTFYKG